MQANDRLKELAEAPLGRLLVRFSWPALVSMTLNALYSIVDRVYIGHGCGQEAMAGLTLAFPIMMLFGAFGVFVGAGHAAVISIKLGENDRTACERILGELVAFKLAFFFVLPPLIFIFLDPILRWTGGSGVTSAAFEQAKIYLRLVIFSHIFSHLAFGLSASMRSEGAVLPSMMCMVVGFGVNLILDPLLIFGVNLHLSTFTLRLPALGVAGAAWATNIAMFLSCAWAFWYYRPGHSAVPLRWRSIRFWPQYLPKACGIGLSPALQQLAGSAIVVALQVAFGKWAESSAACTAQIASLGVFHMAMMLFLLPLMGVQQGLSPIMGYNWGARNFLRVRDTLMLGLWVSTVVVTLAALAQVVAPGLIVRMFADASDQSFIRLASGDLRVSNCMLWCIGLNVVATTYFQSTGHPTTAIILSLLRQCVCLLPCIWILPYVGRATGLFAPSTGVWLSMPVSDVLACLATIPPFLSHARFLSRAGAFRRQMPRGRRS